MRTAMSGAACLAALLPALAAAGTEDAPVAAGEPAAETRSERSRPVTLGPVSARPTAIVERFFEIEAARRSALGKLQAEYEQALRARTAEVEQALNREFEPRALALLDEEEQALYDRLRPAVTAYTKALAQADNAYREVCVSLGIGAGLPLVFNRPQQLVYQVPGLSDAEKRAVMEVYREVMGEHNRRVNAALEAAGLRPPRGRQPDAMREYYRERRRIQQRILEEERDTVTERLAGALGSESAAAFRRLRSAADACRRRRGAARDALVEALREIVPPERLEYNPTRFGR